jgi:hypothetical protein
MRAVAVVLVGLQAVGQEALEEAAKDITLMSLVLAPLSTELQILVVEVVEEAVITVEQLKVQVVQAAQVSSSSRPINNEDKWKPKSIGCMESTPQCTC